MNLNVKCIKDEQDHEPKGIINEKILRREKIKEKMRNKKNKTLIFFPLQATTSPIFNFSFTSYQLKLINGH
jgi:hypothetical protein